ncbi:MAG: NUDIX domain-containing protein [Alphaproteobacteria bacterium]|nr:NUDIX domain-containing protein [Alphaproteobacteria bacterium]MBO4644865.1 NUDIX domain-containing protein [Alphaproteobacteria bacterium]
MVDRKLENIEVVKTTPLYKKFFRVDEYSFKYPLYNGKMSGVVKREVMNRGNAAGVLLYDPDREELVFVEQIRIGAFIAGENPWVLECAAGIIEAGETPEHVAVREAEEEVGAKVSALEPITSYFSSPGGLSEKIYMFCGRVDAAHVAKYGGLPSENEDIRVVVVPVGDAEKMLAEGRFNNALAIISMQWFMINREKLRKKWGKL